jgi:hypothetical protein
VATESGASAVATKGIGDDDAGRRSASKAA